MQYFEKLRTEWEKLSGRSHTCPNSNEFDSEYVEWLEEKIDLLTQEVEVDEYGFGTCDVNGCELESCNSGGCWIETGYWSVCSKHSEQFRSGLPVPHMKSSAFLREASRKDDGCLPTCKICGDLHVYPGTNHICECQKEKK